MSDGARPARRVRGGRPPAAAVEPRAPGSGEPTLEPGVAADPRAVRVTVVGTGRLDDDRPLVVGPPPDARSGALAPARNPLVDGLPAPVRLEPRDARRAVLVEGDGREARRTRILYGPLRADDADGRLRRELVVDGWRVEVEIEHERRAALRERARRVGASGGAGGPVEVRAIIPGRVVSVAVTSGDAVEAGQSLLVVEAMKMQNELRSPRAGTVERVAVEPGRTVDLDDLLVVLR